MCIVFGSCVVVVLYCDVYGFVGCCVDYDGD